MPRWRRPAGAVQDAEAANLVRGARRGDPRVPAEAGHGYADYLLFVDGEAVGVVEAKKEGTTLTGVEVQSAQVRRRAARPRCRRRCGRCRSSTRAPASRRASPTASTPSRAAAASSLPPAGDAGRVGWRRRSARRRGDGRARPSYDARPRRCAAGCSDAAADRGGPVAGAGHGGRATWRRRCAEDRPRALIQMATGSGKTFTADHRRSTG